ncbi:right-handed parallel beta-helix repeat-containing protein [Candidatus Woesearchaeota archaeon]|nr:right-handed parallel beta-helix repeat-containing protein [Candidatus Woesearchaeota archaeon]
MSIKKRGILLLLVFVISLLILAFSVNAIISISDCKFNISTQGEYNLTQDITSSGDFCINITVSNVSLNCEGHSLTGASMNPGIFINYSLSNITIKNCKIDLFAPNIDASLGGKEIFIINNSINSSPSYGIYFAGINNSIIENNSIMYNGDEHSDNGIRMASCGHNKIFNNNISLNGDDAKTVYGMYLSSCGYNGIANNNFDDNSDTAIVVQTSINTNIINNTIKNNSRSVTGNMYGIYVLSFSHNSTVVNNTVLYQEYGIYVSSSYDVNITGNTANNNSMVGIALSGVNNILAKDNIANNNSYGISCAIGKSNNLTSNSFQDNEYGLFFQLAVENTYVSNNTLKDNVYGMNIYFGPHDNTFTNNNLSNDIFDIIVDGAENNTFLNNTVGSYPTTFSFSKYSGNLNISGTDYTYDTNPYRNISKYLNISGTDWVVMNISYADSDVSGISESSLTMFHYTGSAWTPLATTRDETNNVVSANLSSFSIFGPLGSANCSYINYDATLLANISVNTSCFMINASNITFDCAGFTLLGNRSADGYGFRLNNIKNVTIKNCKIYNFSYAIYLNSSINNTITNNSVINNSNSLYFNPDAHNNSVTRNTLSYTTGSGVYTANSCDNIFSENVVNNNTNGFNLASASNRNIIINNSIWGNNWRGIAITNSHTNRLADNNLSNIATWDIRFSSSENNTIMNNTIYPGSVTFSVPRYNGTTTEIKGVENPAADPSGKDSLAKYLNITKTNGDWIEINISYSDSDISSIDESTVGIYRYDGSVWSALSSSLDTTNKVVYSNISIFSHFGLFGDEQSSPSTTPGGGGGGGSSFVGGVTNYNTFDITNELLTNKEFVSNRLLKSDVLEFSYKNFIHTITISDILYSNKMVHITIASVLRDYFVYLNEELIVDIDNNGYNDLIITPASVSLGYVILKINLLDENIPATTTISGYAHEQPATDGNTGRTSAIDSGSSYEQQSGAAIKGMLSGFSEKSLFWPLIGITTIIIIIVLFFIFEKRSHVSKARIVIKTIPEKRQIRVPIKKTVFKPNLFKAFKDFKRENIIKNIISSKKTPAKTSFVPKLSLALKKAEKGKIKSKLPEVRILKKRKKLTKRKKKTEPRVFKKLRRLSKQPKQPDVFDSLKKIYSDIVEKKK